MNKLARTEGTRTLLVKQEAAAPALIAKGRDGLAVKAGTTYLGTTFDADTDVVMPAAGLEAGTDYLVTLGGPQGITLVAVKALDLDMPHLGGFHFAPGGNATAREGGDNQPAINPHSLWDINFRPVCADPRGMVLIDVPGRLSRFWCDIYLTGVDHLKNGTSRCDVRIADGDDPAIDPATKEAFDRFDYKAAQAVMAHHGKSLLSFEEFAHAAFGVTEKSAISKDPKKTGLDAARTSRFGLMQATGNLWVWGHDGDLDAPRASLLGGSWWHEDYAGSRYAVLVYWAENSDGSLGARGRSDHLQLA